MKLLRTLMIEDSDDDALLIIRALQSDDYVPEVERVEYADALEESLRRRAWDVVLCDYNLPGFSADAALGIVREYDPDLPFIIVSGTIGEEAAVEMVRAGAHDYIFKGNLTRLQPAVSREVKEAQVRRDRRIAYEQAEQEAKRRARAEDHLHHAQKMEALGQLTGGIAHDFNNLLTVISGNLEMLDSAVTTATHRELLQEVQDAVTLGAQLTQRLLAFGRRQPLKARPVNLNSLVSDTVGLLRRTLGEAVHVELRLSDDPPCTIADPGQLESALLNLAINARDAMPEGGELLIETGHVEAPPADLEHVDTPPPYGYATITISDTGTGMLPEVLDRAFEPFFTTKGAGIGSGLGLSMVYGFVKQSGGYVRLSSAPGHGTTVLLYLPRTVTVATEVQPAPAVRPILPGHRATVLVVDDDERVRRTVSKQLRGLDYAVLAAANGQEAFDVLAAGQDIDILFTDIVMPGGLSGFDVAREALRLRPHIGVLFTSGYTDPMLKGGQEHATHARWLRKPYSRDALSGMLSELLGR